MKKNKVWLFALVGAIIGVAMVRLFFLNSIQIMGWKLFWNNLASFDFSMFKNAFESATFGRSVLGFLIGGFLGFLSSKMLS
jgi:hypothetical protein